MTSIIIKQAHPHTLTPTHTHYSHIWSRTDAPLFLSPCSSPFFLPVCSIPQFFLLFLSALTFNLLRPWKGDIKVIGRRTVDGGRGDPLDLIFFLLRYARAKTTKNSLLPHTATHTGSIVWRWAPCDQVGLRLMSVCPLLRFPFMSLFFSQPVPVRWALPLFPCLLLLPLMCLLRLPELLSGLSSICLQLWSLSATALPAFSSYRFCPPPSNPLSSFALVHLQWLRGFLYKNVFSSPYNDIISLTSTMRTYY